MVIFYKKWKKYNEIQLTKNKMDLNIQKITNHPPPLPITNEVGDQSQSSPTIEKIEFWTIEKKSQRPNYSSGLPFPQGRYSPKQWMETISKVFAS